MNTEHLTQGKEAETACCRYLTAKGLKLVERNFSCRLGEIDIILTDQETLVFVEVRFRQNNSFGGGLESITRAKQQKLRKTAELYLLQNKQYNYARFDVVSMSISTQTNTQKQEYTFDWIKNAF